MGVAAISELIPRKEIALEELAGRKIALDAFNTIYIFLSSMRDRMTGEPLRDHAGNVTSHLVGLLGRSVRLLEAGIKPVYVFNGKYPQFKERTIKRRRVMREEARRKWKEAVKRGEPALTYARAATAIDVDILTSSKKLLDLMGVPWVQAPSEGEAQCSWMGQQGLVFATGSQDYDSLLFGSPRLVRNLSAVRKEELLSRTVASGPDPELIELQDVLKTLGLTREQLVLLGLLVGTDYNEGIKGVGPVTALRLVKDYQTIENILAKHTFPGQPDVRKVYSFFLNPPHTDIGPMVWPAPDVDGLLRFLVGEHDFSPERARNAVGRLRTAFDKGSGR
jgi:flap endonuclease-1